MRCFSSRAGSGLIEAVVATGVVAIAVATLAGLASLALRSIAAGRDRTMATMYAQAALETFLAARVVLPVSPPDALERDVDGCHEHLDGDGRVAGLDADHAGTVFVRRWRIAPYPGRPGLTVITVLVSRCVTAAAASRGCSSRAGAVRVTGARSEQAW